MNINDLYNQNKASLVIDNETGLIKIVEAKDTKTLYEKENLFDLETYCSCGY